MYGLVCENVAAYIKHKHGKDTWENIRRLANIDVPSFSIHQVNIYHKNYNCKHAHTFNIRNYNTLC